MSTVLDRLLDINLTLPEVGIAGHAFAAFVHEVKEGHMSGADAADEMGMSAAEKAVVGAWITGYAGTREDVEGLLILGRRERFRTKAYVMGRGLAGLDA